MFQLIPMLNIVGFFFVKFYNTWLLIFMPYIFKHNILEFFFFKVLPYLMYNVTIDFHA